VREQSAFRHLAERQAFGNARHRQRVSTRGTAFNCSGLGQLRWIDETGKAFPA
jgi:hypothetical protein